jgi:hypothetical protein
MNNYRNVCATDRLVSSFLATHAKHQGIDHHTSDIFQVLYIFEFVNVYVQNITIFDEIQLDFH